jgi:hypothetical protein
LACAVSGATEADPAFGSSSSPSIWTSSFAICCESAARDRRSGFGRPPLRPLTCGGAGGIRTPGLLHAIVNEPREWDIITPCVT